VAVDDEPGSVTVDAEPGSVAAYAEQEGRADDAGPGGVILN